MRAVVTVIGKDMVGILSKVSGACAGANANVIEVTQSVLQDMFAMIMLVDTQGAKIPFAELVKLLEEEGKAQGLTIHAQREDIFNAMHRI